MRDCFHVRTPHFSNRKGRCLPLGFVSIRSAEPTNPNALWLCGGVVLHYVAPERPLHGGALPACPCHPPSSNPFSKGPGKEQLLACAPSLQALSLGTLHFQVPITAYLRGGSEGLTPSCSAKGGQPGGHEHRYKMGSGTTPIVKISMDVYKIFMRPAIAI